MQGKYESGVGPVPPPAPRGPGRWPEVDLRPGLCGEPRLSSYICKVSVQTIYLPNVHMCIGALAEMSIPAPHRRYSGVPNWWSLIHVNGLCS